MGKRPDPGAELLAEIAAVAARLSANEAENEVLYRRRIELFERGQQMEPRVSQRLMAEAANITESAVGVALSKERDRQRTVDGADGKRRSPGRRGSAA